MEDNKLYDTKFDEVTKEIERINTRLDKVESNYSNLDRSMLKMELMVGNLEGKFDKFETKLDTFIASFNNDKEKENEKKDKRTYDWIKYVGSTILGIIIYYIADKLGIK
jgi:predicted nuclease with TOPRIM domain